MSTALLSSSRVMARRFAHERTVRRKVVRSVELQGRAEGKVALRDGVA